MFHNVYFVNLVNRLKTWHFITFYYIDIPRQRSLCGEWKGFCVGLRVARSEVHTCRLRDQETPFIWRGVMSLFGKDDREQRF